MKSSTELLAELNEALTHHESEAAKLRAALGGTPPAASTAPTPQEPAVSAAFDVPCFQCGHHMRLVKRAGREVTWHGFLIPIPEDMAILTCEQCGAQLPDHEFAMFMSAKAGEKQMEKWRAERALQAAHQVGDPGLCSPFPPQPLNPLPKPPLTTHHPLSPLPGTPVACPPLPAAAKPKVAKKAIKRKR
jgi:hypothetical protein